MRKAFVLVPLVLAIATLALPGEASATPITYKATLDGPSEGTASPGVGSATVIVDDIANLMFVSADFAGLLGNTTAAHIHCCTAVPGAGTAGVATTTPSFPGFPLGVTSGNMDQTFDLLLPGSYNPAFVTAQGGLTQARAALLAGLASDTTYFNIHTSMFPGGEIRGFLAPVPEPVPEPASLALLGLGLGLVGALARRRRGRI